jgi:hypothetical protein
VTLDNALTLVEMQQGLEDMATFVDTDEQSTLEPTSGERLLWDERLLQEEIKQTSNTN